MRVKKQSYILSVQQLVSCDKYDSACDGGLPPNAYKYVYEAGGIMKDSSYPYYSYYGYVSGLCYVDSTKYVARLGSTSYKVIGEPSMGNYVSSTGPLSVAVDATDWNSYTGGIKTVCGTNVNHAVQVCFAYFSPRLFVFNLYIFKGCGR